MELTSLEQRMDALKLTRARVGVQCTMLESRVSTLETEIKNVTEDLKVLDRVSDLFKVLIERHVHEYADSFSEVVTEGLQSIYHDQDVSFGIKVEQKRGKVYATFVTQQGGREGDPLKAFGGGVSCVQSLILRLLVLLKSDLARYLFLDESLAALSSEYVDGCGSFLRELCERLGINVLLVTHNDGFLEHATIAYRGTSDRDGHLSLECLTEST